MITAKMVPTNPDSVIDTSAHLYLASAPFPGDTIITAANQRIRVIKRTWVDHGSAQGSNYVDLELHVRMVNSVDG